MLSQRFYFSVFASAAYFDRHGKIFPQKHSEDRKMEDRKMFVICSLRHGEHCLMNPTGAAKLHVSVIHFSVLAF
jgi:hypothetical protein